MASGISLFIWVVFFFVIVSKVKNASKGGASAKPNVPRKDSDAALRQMFGAVDPTIQRNISEADAAYQQRRRDREAYAQSRTPNAPTGAASAKPRTTAPKPQAAAGPKQAPPLSQQSAAAEKSTTQMLQEKAMLDEAEHRKERWEHDREERKRHGNLKYAQRLYLGDPIPNGKRMVLCSYCNAENLVPAHENASKYNCYFCREYL